MTGKEAEHLLDEVGITVNKNAIPFDPLPPNTASGIRVGTPAPRPRAASAPAEMRRRRRAHRAHPDASARTPPPWPRSRARGARHLRPLPGAGPAPTSWRSRTAASSVDRRGPARRRCLRRGGAAELPADARGHPLRAPRRAPSTSPTPGGASTAARSRAAGGLAVGDVVRGRGRRSPSWSRTHRHVASWPTRHVRAAHRAPPRSSALFVRRGRGRGLRLHRRPLADPRALAAPRPARAGRHRHRRAASSSVRSPTRSVPGRAFGDRARPPRSSERPVVRPVLVTDALDRGHDQQHQLHRRPRRAVDRRRAHRGPDAGRHLHHGAGPTSSRWSRSCAPCWPGALVGFLPWNFHPARGLHRHDRRVSPWATRWRCCRSWARPRSPWRCWSWACRSSTRSGSSSGASRQRHVAVHARSRPLPPPPAGPGPHAPRRGAAHLRHLRRPGVAVSIAVLVRRRAAVRLPGHRRRRRPGAVPAHARAREALDARSYPDDAEARRP